MAGEGGAPASTTSAGSFGGMDAELRAWVQAADEKLKTITAAMLVNKL